MVGVNWEETFLELDPYFTDVAAKGIRERRLHPDLAKLHMLMEPIQLLSETPPKKDDGVAIN
jgi:hypothetical protein